MDSDNNELVVGIVDYIRTYTWDKKLESWVKESTFLGGAGKGEPTIVTPRQYRQRFLASMERYFPLASSQLLFLVQFITQLCQSGTRSVDETP